MNCPFCGSDDTKVLETRADPSAAGVRRRRRCAVCDGAYYTIERVDTTPLVVVSRGGRRQDFDRKTLIDSLAVAGAASLPEPRREAVAEAVVARLRDRGPVVTSQEIGLAVLEQLRRVHIPTFVRYAIAFLRPADLDDFDEWLAQQLTEEGATLADDPNLIVIKRDGTRELFQTSKIAASLRHASRGRGLDVEQRLVAEAGPIRDELLEMANAEKRHEVSSREVSDRILFHLRAVDLIAYLHYAVTVKNLDTYTRLQAEITDLRQQRVSAQ